MKPVILAAHSGYRLTSYGNGTAYTLAETETGLSVFFQGDDATLFREEMEVFEEHNPEDDLLEYLWCLYSGIATREGE